MSSRSNDIHTDIRDLLGTDTLTPEMERVVGIMRAYRPRVDIDASYRNKLKKSLLTPSTKKITHTRPSWFAWMSWVGTSFAALIVTLGVVRILFPERPITPEHTALTVESPLPEVATLMQDATSDTMVTSEILSESQSSEALATRPTTPMTRMTDVQATEPTGSTPTSPVANTTLDNTPNMLADASVGGGYMMMAMPEGDALAKTSTAMPAMMATPPVDTVADPVTSDISSEIQDMVWEINAIVNEAGGTITIPDYPTSMPIYSKESLFAPEETALLVGSGITSTLIPTYTPTELEALIIEKRGSMVIASSPEVRYMSYKKGNQSILVPTVIYTTTSGMTLEVALVAGY